MATQCNPRTFQFHGLFGGEVLARFDGGRVSSDGGGILLRENNDRFHFVERLAQCFTDHRDPEKIDHPLPDLLKQRIFGLCLGYEDLIDHDKLRHDPLLAVLVGKADPEGLTRENPRDCGKALAGKSTLNRLELTPVGADADSRYKKITANLQGIQQFFVEAFLAQHILPPQHIVLDFDATDDPVHGDQLGKFFNGYYDEYCFLPLYCFCGDHPLLETAQADTIRLKLLKIGAVIRVSVRKVWIALSEAYPWQELFAGVYDRLTAWRCVPQLNTG